MKENNLELLTLSKFNLDKEEAEEIRNGVDVGKWDVDFLCRVRGTVVVGEDYEQRTPVQLPLEKVLGFLVAKTGLELEKSLVLLEIFVQEALEGKELPGEARAVVNKLEEIKKNLANQLPKKKCKGKVLAKGLHVEVLKVVE